MVNDWIAEYTDTTGRGDITLIGAVDSFARFQTMASGDIPYSIVDGENRESGLGTFDGNVTLVRTQVLTTIVNGIFDHTSPLAIDLSGEAIVSCTFTADDFNTFTDHLTDSEDPHNVQAIQTGYDASNDIYTVSTDVQGAMDDHSNAIEQVAGDLDLAEADIVTINTNITNLQSNTGLITDLTSNLEDIVGAVDGDTCFVRDLRAGGEFVYDSSKIGDNDGGVTFNGWVRQYACPVNVAWFAIDDSTDDTLAIQNAIDYVASLNGEVGGGVFFPAGDYYVSKIHITTGGIVLMGEGSGTRLLCNTALGDGVVFEGETGLIFKNGARDMYIGQGDLDGTEGSALVFTNTGQSFMDHISGGAYPNKAYNYVTLTDVTSMTIDDLQIAGAVHNGFVANNCTDIYISNSRSDSHGNVGMVIEACGGVYLSNTTSHGNVVNGIYMLSSTFMFATNTVADTSNDNNWIVQGCTEVTLSNCWASDQPDDPTPPAVLVATANGFYFTDSNEVTLSACQARLNNNHGLKILPNCSDITVIGGAYNDNSSLAADGCGIEVDGDSVSIQGATCSNVRRTSQADGIRVQNNATNVSIDGAIAKANLNENIDITNTTGLKITNVISDDPDTVASANTMQVPNTKGGIRVSGTTTISAIAQTWDKRGLYMSFDDVVQVGDGFGNINLEGGFTSTAGAVLHIWFNTAANEWQEISRSIN